VVVLSIVIVVVVAVLVLAVAVAAIMVVAVVMAVLIVPTVTVKDRNGRCVVKQMHHQPSFDRRTPRVFWDEGAAEDPDSS
jgi:hypothetical protein